MRSSKVFFFLPLQGKVPKLGFERLGNLSLCYRRLLPQLPNTKLRFHARRCYCIYAISKAAVLFANLLQPQHVTVYGMAAAPDLSLCSMTSLLYVYRHQDNLEMHNGLLKF